MKIVLAAHHYPPTYLAGVELVAERLARWLVGRGHHVEVVCIEDIDTAPPLRVDSGYQDGVLVHRLYLKLTGGPLPLGVRHRDSGLEAWFDAYLAQAKPDVFHSLSSYLFTASLLDSARRAGIPTVASMHDYWYVCPRIILQRSDGSRCDGNVTPTDCARCILAERRRFRIPQALERQLPSWAGSGHPLTARLTDPGLVQTMWEREQHLENALRDVDAITTPAPLTRELLLARGFSPEHVRHVRHGIRQPPEGTRRSAPLDGQLRLVYLGQLAPHKGVHVLIDSMKRVAASKRVARLTIYGDDRPFPDYAANLKRLAASSPTVQFGGMYRNDQVWNILADCDMLVVPSLWFEISPLVILEAYAAGVPVMASDLRNMNSQIRDGVDGLLFEAGDPGALARRIQQLADEPDLIERLRAGVSPARTLDAELSEVEAVYAEVTGPRVPTPSVSRASVGD